MFYAAIRQGPLGATRLNGIDKKAGLASRDVLYVVEHDRWVAAVARHWWAANRALDRFAPVFETSGAPISSARIDAALASPLAHAAWRIAPQAPPTGQLGGARSAARVLP